MPLEFGPTDLLTQIVWTSPNFASGGATTTLSWGSDYESTGDIIDGVQNIVDLGELHLAPIMDVDVTCSRVLWATATFSGEIAGWGPGTQARTAPPPNFALLQTFRASEKGPRNRGRVFWPGMANEGDIDERGQIASSLLDGVNAALDSFFNGMVQPPNITEQRISQSTTPGQVTPPNVPWPAVVSRTLQIIGGTQRRRMRR